MNFLSQGDGNNSSTYNTNLGGWYLHVLISHPHTVHSTCCVCWLMFSHSLEMKVKKKKLVEIIFRNFAAIPQATGGKCFITVRLKTDELSVPSPVQDPAPGLGSG